MVAIITSSSVTAARRPSVGSNFASLADVKQAMMKKLKESTLTASDVERLKLTPFTAAQVQHELRELTFARAGFKIPYFNINGKQDTFYRFRYLEYDNGHGFGKLVHSNGNGKALRHDIRYVQPAETLPQVYLPPTVPWTKLCKTPTIPLTITEGELKAACACKHDIACIGLGGVWSFKSSRNGMHILPILEEFQWAERLVYICFDSDASTNPDVCAAEYALAHELTNLGAVVHICRLPPLDGHKCGLDDYIASAGAKSFKEDVWKTAEPFKACEELYRLNGEVTYVQDPGVILKLETNQRIAPRAFVDHAYANRIWYETVQAGKSQKTIERSAPREWLKWPHRSAVNCVTYRPGEGRFVNNELNVWPGWGCVPEKGDVKPWLEYLDYVFADHDDRKDRIHWFQQWLAYPLQHPGTKLNQSVLIWSVEQGTGKSVIGYVMKEIYGDNFAEINDRHLLGNFNGWAENRQFVMGDEIASTGEKRRDTADRMKSIITQHELRINAKYIPEYTVPDCINYYFTSNHCDAFFLDDGDRRFFIHEIKRQPKSQKWYKEFCDWSLRGAVGAGHVFYHLLHYSLDGFDPQGHAPITSSKKEMIESSKNELAVWCGLLRDDPDQVLKIGNLIVPYRLWTNNELFKMFDAEGRTRWSAEAMGRELRKVGFRQMHNGQPVRTSNGLQRLWAIRRADELVLLDNHKVIAEMYAAERKQKGKAKF